jgi:hypothetical protein
MGRWVRSTDIAKEVSAHRVENENYAVAARLQAKDVLEHTYYTYNVSITCTVLYINKRSCSSTLPGVII